MNQKITPQKMGNQQIRAAALQAAATFFAHDPTAPVSAVLNLADDFTVYIARGRDLAPPQEDTR